jgi:hypothetical protein
MLRRNMTQNFQHDPAHTSPASVGGTEYNRCSPPPLVYRAADEDKWVVEPPGAIEGSGETTVFTGSRAKELALTYACERFGKARFFPYSG